MRRKDRSRSEPTDGAPTEEPVKREDFRRIDRGVAFCCCCVVLLLPPFARTESVLGEVPEIIADSFGVDM